MQNNKTTSETDKNTKIKKLLEVYDILLNHLNELTILTKTIDLSKENIDRIIELNNFHVSTRKKAKIFEEDLTDLSNNFMYKIMAKDISPTSIQFINLITEFNQNLIDYQNDNVKLQETIDNISELNVIAQKQFKKLKKYFS